MKNPRTKKKKPDRRTASMIIFAFTMLLTTGLVIVQLFAVQHVRNFKVKNNSHYTDEEIIAMSGIEKGARLFSVDPDEAEKRLADELPFIRGVKVSRRFFSTVVIKVEEEVPKYYTEQSGEYFLLSEKLRVLEKSYLPYENHISLRLPELDTVIVGQALGFASETDEQYVKEFAKTLSEAEYGERITAIGASDRYFGVYIVLGGKYKIVLGSTADLELKMLAALESINRHGAENDYGEVNASDYTAATYKSVQKITY